MIYVYRNGLCLLELQSNHMQIIRPFPVNQVNIHDWITGYINSSGWIQKKSVLMFLTKCCDELD